MTSPIWDPKNPGHPKDVGKFKDFINAELARLRKMLKKAGSGAGAQGISDAIDDGIEAGKAAGLEYSGEKFK